MSINVRPRFDHFISLAESTWTAASGDVYAAIWGMASLKRTCTQIAYNARPMFAHI